MAGDFYRSPLILRGMTMFFNRNKKTSMETEVFEQPEILNHIIENSINDDNYILFDVPSDVDKFVLVASGSSYHSARFAADLFGNIAQLEARAIYSSEFLLKSAVPHADNILYIFITQSGETSDTNKALNKAKQFGVRTLCITNKKDSTIWQASDFKVDCHAGEEKSIAATKSLTAQMLCLALIVLKYASLKGIDITNYINDLHTLADAVQRALSLRPEIKKTAGFLTKYKNIVITADGISYALAKEACLKIKETSYLNVIASILGEFMHGHVAVLNNKSALLYLTVNELSYTATKNLNKIKDDYNPPVILIGNSNDKVNVDYKINIEIESEMIKSFAVIVICQLLAFEIATRLNRNVDKPKGLHKVVV